MANRNILLFLMLLFFAPIYGQEGDWELTKETDNIEVYTRKLDGEKFKEIKILTRCKTTLNAIMAAFEDTEGHKDWVYKSPESYTVEEINDHTLIYYIKSDLPFPATDRDLVIKYTWTQDPDTKIISTLSEGVVGKVEEYDANIRVKDFISTYKLTPRADGWVDIEYYAKMDPAGMLPAWLVNLAVTSGPIKTMDELFKILESGKYDNIDIQGISELK
jgi:hypothetical protein